MKIIAQSAPHQASADLNSKTLAAHWKGGPDGRIPVTHRRVTVAAAAAPAAALSLPEDSHEECERWDGLS